MTSNFAFANADMNAELLKAARMRDHYRALVAHIGSTVPGRTFTAAEFRDANEELEFWGNRLAFLDRQH